MVALSAFASFAQRRLWLLDQLYGQRATYSVPTAYRLTGPLDAARLQQRLNAVLGRHEVLRTCFRFEDGDLRQLILPELVVPIAVHDLVALPTHERMDAAIRRVHADADRPFDLAVAPLLRASLYRLGEHYHLFAFNVHHALFDGWSERLLIDELFDGDGLASAENQSASSERCPERGPLPLQYRDFAAWQRERVATPAMQASLTAWCERLVGAPTHLHLPYDAARPDASAGTSARVTLAVPSAMVKALRMTGGRRGATLFMTLLAAYSVVLHRYSGDREVMIGTVLLGRTRPEFEALIGLFVNTVALRVDFGGTSTFAQLLERVKHLSLEAQLHQDVPFDLVVEALHPERAAGTMPLFQTMFVMENIGGSRTFGTLALDPVPIHNGTAKCDLLLGVLQTPDGLTCTLDYDTELFHADTASGLIDSFRCVLEGVVADADQPVPLLPVVSQDMRTRLATWGETSSCYQADETIHRAFEAVVARTPDAVALSLGSSSLTYAELDARANRLASYLQRQGVEPGALVGIAMGRTLDAIVAQVATLKAGAAYLPLDVTEPGLRVAALLDAGDVQVVLTDALSASRVPPRGSRIVDVDRERARINQEPSLPAAHDGAPDDVAYVMFTSGSTGRPNGVRVPHRAVLRLVLAGDYVDWARATTFLQLAPLTFDASTFEIWGALLRGKKLVLFPGAAPSLSGLGVILRRERVDCLWLTAALFNAVIDEQPECLQEVSQLLVGGDTLSVAHIQRAQDRLPRTQLINGYGPTECTTFTCCYTIPPLGGRREPIPIGRPIAGTSVAVLDAYRQPVPAGVIGELYVGGNGVALGYLQSATTEERFVADPRGGSTALWYRTGDRVRWRRDGVLEIHGRCDAQVKIRGFRVEPGEVEAVCRQHPRVRDAAVVIDRTSSEPALTCFVVGATPPPSSDDVRRFLATRLPAHLRPSAFVVVDALPRTANGKIDRQALLRWPTAAVVPSESAAPRSPTEEKLVALWCEALRCARVGIHDNFFERGGHSLLAMTLFARIETIFGQRLSASTLISRPTVATLAELIDQPVAMERRSLTLVPLQPQGERPPLLVLHDIGNSVLVFRDLARQLGPEQPVFGVVSVDERAFLPLSVEDRVAGYAADIDALVPKGPLALGGFCSGAVLAFELARQLRARGREVPTLLVFDYRLADEPAGIAALATDAARWVVDDLVPSTRRGKFGVRTRLRRLRGRWSGHDRTDAPHRHRDREQRLRQESLVKAYRFPEYDGAVTVFQARCRSLARRHPSNDLGWGPVVSGPLHVERVPGAHHTIFWPPYVHTLGERVTAALRGRIGRDAR